jgi:hypothetical protein
MASEPEKAFSVLAFHETKSVVTVQLQFRRKYGKNPPSRLSVRAWYYQFVTDGCVCRGKSSGRPFVSTELVETTRQSFVRSPHKSVQRVSKELDVTKTTVWQVPRKRLHLRPCRLQILRQIKPTDKLKQLSWKKLADNDTIMNKLVFSDEARST